MCRLLAALGMFAWWMFSPPPSSGQQRAADPPRQGSRLACRLASYGKFQIMGFNFRQAGFDDLQDFINAMYTDEAHQLDAFVDFVANDGRLLSTIKTGDAAGFAKAYNGANYAINTYDQKLVAAGF